MKDISAIQPATRTIELRHPATDAPIGVRVSLISINDPKMKAIKRKIQDEKLRLEARNKNFKSEDLEHNTNEMIFGAMTGWEWYNPTGKPGDKGYDPEEDAAFKGEKPEFTRASVMRFLNEPGMSWAVDQIVDAISEEKAFFKVSKAI